MWSNPEVIGQCVIFIGFVMKKLNNTRAIVFGGADNDTNSQGSSVYLLDIISISKVVCIYIYIDCMYIMSASYYLNLSQYNVWANPWK